MAATNIRVDVNLYDPTQNSSVIASAVPLEKYDIHAKKLQDLRKDLIAKGGIEASKAGSSFCSPSGALVNDSTSFPDYLDIVSEVPQERNDAGNEESSTGEKASNNKATKRPVYNVYLKLKTRDTGPVAEAKEAVAKELNLKLRDKPELLQTSLEVLKSSFNRQDWVAQSGEITNPADMSEKEWNIVIRNNSLTSGHRLVFSRGAKGVDDDDALKFRRIERAPYSAFVLRPRKFQPHEMSDATVQVEQKFRMPRFVVSDDSYVDVFETESSVSTAMARSSFSSIDAQASVGGGAFGYSASVSAGFSQNESSALSNQSTREEKTMNITYNFPRVVMHLDQYSLELSEECKEDLKKVTDAAGLIDFHHKYGHFFATRIELGGRLFSSEKFSTLGASNESEATKAMKIAASASLSGSSFSASASSEKEDSSATKDSSSTRNMQNAVSWQAQGGNTLLSNNPPAWCSTVGAFQMWRVIKQEDMFALGEFISKMPHYKHIRGLFDKLAGSTRKKQTVSFKLRLQDWQRKNKIEPEYVTLDIAAGLKNDFKQLYSAQWISLINEQDLPPDLSQIIIHGHKHVIMKNQDADSPNVFDIEVETVLDQAPQIEFRKRYKLYNRKTQRWLGYRKLNVLKADHWVLVAGYEDEATYFEFRDAERTGPIRPNDPFSLHVYDSGDRDKASYKGLLSLAFNSTSRPLGALYYAAKDENRIRFLNFEPVEQRFVPQ